MPNPVASPQPATMTAPSPTGHPILGHLRAFARDPLGLIDGAFATHGDIVRLRLGQRVHLIRHPDHVRHVLQDNHLNYRKSFLYARMKPLVGEGLLTSEGDYWRRNRRMVQPAFHHQRLAGFVATINRHTSDLLDEWDHVAAQGQSHDVAAEMTRLTFGIAGATLMGIDLRHEALAVGDALRTAVQITNRRFSALAMIPPSLPIPENRRFAKAMGVINDLVERVITRRRDEAAPPHDFLALLMAARDDEDGSRLTDQQLRDEVTTMFLAGHETTAHMLSWAWYLMATHPDVTGRVQAEVDSVLGGRPPSFEDVGRLPYLRMVLDEVLRLYPPAYLIGRMAVADDSLGGYRIAAGSSVVLSIWSSHRMPEFWPNPTVFDPERFLPDRRAGEPRYAYYPFAGGPRQCIGRDFALMEGVLIAAAVLQRYRMHVVPNHPIIMEQSVTLYPRHGVRVQLERR